MQTLKQIKEWFAEDLYSWVDKNDFEYEWELDEMIKDYIDELTDFNPEWEDENKIREAWYVRWYEVALKDILNDLTNIAMFDEMKSDKDIENYINNLLNN